MRGDSYVHNAIEEDPRKAALRKIVKQSSAWPSWQRDALRRVILKSLLTSADTDEVICLCKQSHGLLADSEIAPDIRIIEDSDLPSGSTGEGAVVIEAIGSLKRVNALDENQTLAFSSRGLTVVYGDNGAGKSGCCKVLKAVCSARDRDQEILPNAYETPSTGQLTARIQYSRGGEARPDLVWSPSEGVHPELTRVNVFDSRCAVVHVDGKNSLAYTPLPLLVLQQIAKVCVEVATRLKAEKRAIDALPQFRRDPKSRKGSTVHEKIEKISAISKIAEFRQLATLDQSENDQLVLLKKVLAVNPEKKIKSVSALKERLESLIRLCESVVELADGTMGTELSKLTRLVAEKSRAMELAAKLAFADEPIPQAGSETWKLLWEAARRFSNEIFLPASFPVASEESFCPLCQQPLEDEAIARMSRFELFVQQQLERDLEVARTNLSKLRTKISSLAPTKAQRKEAVHLLRDELDRPELCNHVVRYLARAAVRSKRPALSTPVVSCARESNPRAELRALVSRAEKKLMELRRSERSEERARQQKELYELEDREWLSSVMPDCEAEIWRLKKLKNLEAAIAAADTSRITRCATELSKELVTAPIRDAFAAEIAALGVADRRVELAQESSNYGAAKFRVTLVRAVSAQVGSVLSEGEHRCVALSAFFAELATASDRSGIVFDDPVSSLDHRYRDLVARRIVREASQGRQVVVFTHDVVFLERLCHYAREEGTPTKCLTISRVPDSIRTGIVENGIPSTVAPAFELAESLDRQVRQLEQAYMHGKVVAWNEKTGSFATQLRKCWERAVAEVIEPVVRRFDSHVDTRNVWQIAALDPADFVIMRTCYKRCSELSHEQCAVLGRKDPTPSDYYAEITAIRSWLTAVRDKQRKAQESRPVVS